MVQISRRQFLASSSAVAAAAPRASKNSLPRALFPPGFVWGAASAALQVEGSVDVDGRGADIWLPFYDRKGAAFADHNPRAASDHYRRYREDVALMKDLRLPSYRFSVAWPRVIPNGTGQVNAKGLDFYDRLVDELLGAGIDPYLMLYHWELPLALEQRGGWRNRDIVGWFADYVAVVTKRLSDRVRHFMTVEEPQVFIGMGYLTGEYAPGYKVSHAEYLNAVHNTLLAHGRACQSVRANAKQKVSLAAVFGCPSFWPVSNARADVEAARTRTFWVERNAHWNGPWYIDPILLGTYPAKQAHDWRSEMPIVQSGDMDLIRQPLDFIGLNVYNSRPIRAANNAAGWDALPPQTPAQDMFMSGQLLSPEGLYWSPRFYWERYKTPIFITENGCGVSNWVSLDGKVHDPQRIDYLSRYLLALARAVNEGARVIGYHHWSFLDSFEWENGYRQRMGLVHVDYRTQKRTVKDSAYFFADLASSNGAALAVNADINRAVKNEPQ